MLNHVRKIMHISAIYWLTVGLIITAASAQAQTKALVGSEQVKPGDTDKFDGKSHLELSQDANVDTRIMVLHATNAKGGIDPKLGHLSQLTKPPFSSYDTYRLLSTQQFTLRAKQSQTIKLPNGRNLKTELKAVLPEERYRISTSISRPSSGNNKQNDEEQYLPLLDVTSNAGEPFFVAGQSYREGILVVGIQVGDSSEQPRNQARPDPKDKNRQNKQKEKGGDKKKK